MKRSHGGNSKHSRDFVSKGRLPITRQLAKFNVGERVRFDANPSHLKGRINTLRFNRKVGTVVGEQGRSYVVKFNDLNKEKTLIVSKMHLVRV